MQTIRRRLRLVFCFCLSCGAVCFTFGFEEGRVGHRLQIVRGIGSLFSSTTLRGSSLSWLRGGTTLPPSDQCGGLCNDCTALGELCDFTHIVVRYCDGSSFAGNAPHVVGPGRQVLLGGKRQPLALHFRGREILHTAVRTMFGLGLVNATEVLFSGCSAGGLAALLSADAVRAQVRGAGVPVRKFKVAAFSGLFAAWAPNDAHDGGGGGGGGGGQQSSGGSGGSIGSTSGIGGTDGTGGIGGIDGTGGIGGISGFSYTPFAAQIRSMAALSQMVMPSRCADRFDAARRHRCLLGTAPLDGVPSTLPLFIEQSTLDNWASACALGAGSSTYYKRNCSMRTWAACTKSIAGHRRTNVPATAGNCSRLQRQRLQGWQSSFAGEVAAAKALSRAGSGAFVHGCHSHCFGAADWGGRRVGGFSLAEAFTRWWHSDNEPAENHVHAERCYPEWQHTHTPRRLRTSTATSTAKAPATCRHAHSHCVGPQGRARAEWDGPHELARAIESELDGWMSEGEAAIAAADL